MAQDPLGTAKPDAKDSRVQDLDQLYTQAKSGRQWLEPTWLLNLAYYNGDQWLAWNGRNLFQPHLRPNRITVVDNRILGCVRTEIAKMTKNRPVFTVVPTTSDDENVDAAEIGEQVMRYLWRHLDAQEIVTKALFWSRITGAGFVKCYWDSTVGDSTEVLVGSDGQPLTGQGGKPLRPDMGIDPKQLATSMGLPEEAIRVKRICRGDIQLEARSPFQMFPDPLCDSFDEVEWLVEESVKSKEFVKQRYRVELQPDTPANPGMVEVKMGTFRPGSSAYKGIKLRELWAKPSSKYPNGRRVVWAQGKVLVEDENPFDAMPYVMFSSIPVPGRLWPTSITEQLRGPQTELNKVKSQLAENRNRIGNPTILASKQAVQDPEKFVDSTTIPGGVYFFDDVGSPNAVPRYLDAPQMPAYVPDEITRIEESIAEISGQHEVTSAQVPPGVTAASAINLLQEADDTRLGPGITDFERQLEKLGQKILEHVAAFYTDARTIRLAGDNAAWQIFDFRGAMLRGNTNVQVQTGSAFPQSKAAKQAAIQEMLTFFVQSGNPPKGRQLAQFLQDWDIGGLEKLIEQWTKDETQTNRENVQLSQGTPLPVNSYDVDQAHIEAHEDFQKGQRYQNLPPQIKQIFEQHVQMHRQRLQQQQMQQFQMQLQMEGKSNPQQDQADQAQQQQQMQQQAAQTHQQLQLKGAQAAQQQGVSQAQSEQQQRQAEELHHQKIRHAEEQHQMRLAQMAEQARQQARQQQTAAKRR